MSPTSTGTSRFLDLRALASLANMRLAARHRTEGPYSGRYPSRQLGGAGEFVDYREYSDGEDLRRLDWKVLGRSGRAYIRLYQDETNLCCTFALDSSGSMRFAGANRMSKIDYAKYLTTALSYLIAHGQDQVALAILGERLIEHLALGSTTAQVARLHAAVEELMTAPSRRMAAALRELFEQSTRRGVLIVESDFLMDDLDDTFAALRLFRRSGWRVQIWHLVHPDEERLPEGVAFRFEGLEDDGGLSCSPGEIRAEYEKRFAAHLAMVRSQALAGDCDYRLLSTAMPYLQVVRSFLVSRQG
ncbi:MAG TPA: DUF58 domain-containing protein [Pirellulales bacterium]|jgi:uncharacterized protein (DUF58 family)|nr:DUF58 domain-containing protein [Pirellulales bacterium]